MQRKSMDVKLKSFERLLKIMDELREQCPWDKKQTFLSLRNLTIEETYELADELLDENLEGIREELGDLFLHMVFYSRIGEEKGAFDVADVLNQVCEKLIRRHPHIYGNVRVKDEEEVKQNWEKLKMKEGKKSILSGVPQSLPALVKAYRMQEKTAKVGFEWDETEKVWQKVKEEFGELEEARKSGNKKDVEEEFGDALFALVNYARFIDVDPETALARSNSKFKQRFEYIEEKADGPLDQMSLEDMDALWNEAKVLEKNGS
jgi:XTP/dITP diphosphohydrolase